MNLKKYASAFLISTFLSNGHSSEILPDLDLRSIRQETSVKSFSKVFKNIQDLKEDDVVFLNIDGILLSKGADKKNETSN